MEASAARAARIQSTAMIKKPSAPGAFLGSGRGIKSLLSFTLPYFLDANRHSAGQVRPKCLARVGPPRALEAERLTGAGGPARPVLFRAASSRVSLGSLLRYFGRRKRVRCLARIRPARSHLARPPSR